jgi:hypothetical protein
MILLSELLSPDRFPSWLLVLAGEQPTATQEGGVFADAHVRPTGLSEVTEASEQVRPVCSEPFGMGLLDC